MQIKMDMLPDVVEIVGATTVVAYVRAIPMGWNKVGQISVSEVDPEGKATQYEFEPTEEGARRGLVRLFGTELALVKMLVALDI